MEAIKTFKHKTKNRLLEIYQDLYPTNPREEDNLGLMVCKHKDYDLGDEKITEEGMKFAEYELFLIKEKKAKVILPLYLYDHTEITINYERTYPFTCPWDTSEVGYIYATEDMIKKWFNVDKVGEKELEDTKKILKQEVKTYDNYIKGEIYLYNLLEVNECNLGHKHENLLDSCGGFFYSDNLIDDIFIQMEEKIDDWEEE